MCANLGIGSIGEDNAGNKSPGLFSSHVLDQPPQADFPARQSVTMISAFRVSVLSAISADGGAL
jgi:hypothetical protein